MKKQKKSQTGKKDTHLQKILNSRMTYIALLGLVLLYRFQDDRILNIPTRIFIITLAVSFFAVMLFLLLRFRAYTEYYKRKLNDKIYIAVLILVIVIFSFLLQGIISIPLNVLIKRNSVDSLTETFECPISNVITTGTDKIHFVFMGSTYSRYFEVNGFDRKDLIEHYILEIEAKKSLWDTYYIERMSLKKKQL